MGPGFWGVRWEDLASSLPHPSPTLMGPHLTCWGIRAVGCPSVSCKVPRAPFTVYRYCHGAKISLYQQTVVCTGGSLAVPPGICLCHPFLKLYSFLLDPQHLLNKVMSIVHSTAFCHFSPQPAVLQFGGDLILPQFLQLTSRFFDCLSSHFSYAPLPKACPRPSVVIQVWLYQAP